MAVFLLLAALIAWIGNGFHTALTATVSAVLVLAALWHQRKSRGILAHLALMLPVGLITSTGVFFCVLRFQALNIYNDAFFYLVEAQWLQSHPFPQRSIPSPYHPALVMVSQHQVEHLRAGASFLHGWLQSVFGFEWSFSAYPLAMALPLAVGSIALAGAIYGMVGKSRYLCLALGMLAGTSLNGFSFGSLFGFLAQTYGLAFGFAGVALCGVLTSRGGGWVRASTKAAIALPVSLCFVGVLFCYPESAPFVAVGGLVSLGALAVADRSKLRQSLTLLVFVVLEMAALGNLEFVRAYRALPAQFGRVLGNPVVWNPLYAVMHSGGFLAGAWEGRIWLLRWPALTIAGAVAVAAIAALGFAHSTGRLRTRVVWPLLGVLAVSIAAFVYFCYFAISPWDGKVGHSWNEFRVSSWATLYMLALIGGGLAASWARYRLLRPVILVIAIGWNLAGIVQNFRLASIRTAQVRADTNSSSQLAYYLAVREALKAEVGPEDGIYLENLGGDAHYKARQVLMYFLSDYKLLSDYSDDAAVNTWFPPDKVALPVREARWILSRTWDKPLDGIRINNLVLSRTGTDFVSSGEVTGGYGREPGGWYETHHELVFRYGVTGRRPVLARVKFSYRAVAEPGQARSLTIEFHNGAAVRTEHVPMKGGWTDYVSPPIQITEREFALRLSSNDPPRRVSDSDFLARNVDIEETAPETSLEQAGVTGGYPEESDANSQWRWTANELVFRYRVTGKRPVVVRVRFGCQAAVARGQVRTLKIEFLDGDSQRTENLVMNRGWSEYVSPPVSITGPEFVLRLSSSQPPLRVSAEDPRMMAFRVGNLKMTIVQPKEDGGER